MSATTLCVLRIIFYMEIKTRAQLKSLNIQIVFITINLPLIWPVHAKTQYSTTFKCKRFCRYLSSVIFFD